MNVAVVLFTSDLRLHDNPVLRSALRDADRVVPLFVRDDAVHRAGFDAPNRLAFLADCLADLDAGLRKRAAGSSSVPVRWRRRCAGWSKRPGRGRCTWPPG